MQRTVSRVNSSPQSTILAGLKKLRVRLFEEEPEGKEVANLRFLTNSLIQNLSGFAVTERQDRIPNFQIFNSEPQSIFFRLDPITGILRIARRIDRDQLCPTFRSCCSGSREVDFSLSLDLPEDDVASAIPFASHRSSDYPKQLPDCRLDLNVRSDDQYSKIILVHVHIVDINDNSPVWPKTAQKKPSQLTGMDDTHEGQMVVQVSENSLIGDSVTLTPAYDADTGENGISRYALTPDTAEFSVKWIPDLEFPVQDDFYEASPTHTGQSAGQSDGQTNMFRHNHPSSTRHELRLVVRKLLDRETRDIYDFVLTAYDGGSPSRNASVPLRVVITDANDNSPKFEKETYTVELKENARPHTPVIQVVATDADTGINSRIKYRFSSLTKPDFVRLFSLDAVTGWIYVQWEIDYETHKKILLTVEAVDSGNLPRASTCIVEITVLDENDHAPEIRFEPAYLTNFALVPENEKPGRLVAVFTASDQDSGSNGRVSCHLNDPQRWRFESNHPEKVESLVDDPLQTLFKLQQMQVPFSVIYKLTTAATFDREVISRVMVWITCSDYGQPQRNTTASVSVRITDVNDERPSFGRSNFYFSVKENILIGTMVFTVNATDSDEGMNSKLTYWLSGPDEEYFTMNENSGQVQIRKSPDRELQDTLKFQIHARDHGTPPLNATVDITVSVIDVNDNAPEIPPQMELMVFENHTASGPVGQMQYTDRDIGRNAEVSFSLVQCVAYPTTNANDGRLSNGRRGMFDRSTSANATTVAGAETLFTFFIAKDGRIYLGHAKLDREKYSLYELKVRAEDHGHPQLFSTAIVTIRVLDVNDNAPRFIFPTAGNNTVYVPQTTSPGHTIARVEAVDEDVFENGEIVYEMKFDQPEKNGEMFEIDSLTGEVRLKQRFIYRSQEVKQKPEDVNGTGRSVKTNRTQVIVPNLSREPEVTDTVHQAQRAAFSLLLTASDRGNPRLKTSTILRILFTPPFYPPERTRLQAINISDVQTTKLSANHNEKSLNAKRSRPVSSGDSNIEDDLTGLGILLGLVVAVGLFVCFVLLVITILLKQSQRARRRRRCAADAQKDLHTSHMSPVSTVRIDGYPSPIHGLQSYPTCLGTIPVHDINGYMTLAQASSRQPPILDVT
ncbi:unnamed protein product [Calicophoron daubneyi]|uniref:Cadherin domain-containing protein n=1 Tax=Calicophoron daubneyi TaxID=300641 RepID=A0AAV2TW88_CALDB